jgi:hypothetical protein
MRSALLVRHLWIWALVRGVHAVVGAAAGTAGGVPILSGIRQPQPAVVLVCAALGIVEVLRRRERILLGNLGIGWRELAALIAGPALVVEAAVGVVGAW